jgi:outer membrane lipoprotein carrier protein
MSWRYAANGNRVVADGKTLRVYEGDNKQMYEQPMDQSQYPAALAFLLGGGSVKKSFSLQRLDGARLGFTGGWSQGRTEGADPAYQTLLLYGRKNVAGPPVMLIDVQGNRNRFTSEPERQRKAPGRVQVRPAKGHPRHQAVRTALSRHGRPNDKFARARPGLAEPRRLVSKWSGNGQRPVKACRVTLAQ